MRLLLVLLLSFLSVLTNSANENFNRWFREGALRVDFILSGNADECHAALYQVKEEPYWGGSHINLIDTLGYGSFVFNLYDSLSGVLIYSRGFSTLFEEWQHTKWAVALSKAFEQSVNAPFPKSTVCVEILRRTPLNNWKEIFRLFIDPAEKFIARDHSLCAFKTIMAGAIPAESLDIAILAEGYTEIESDKFYNDARRLSGYMMAQAPFNKFRNQFNINAVFCASADAGVDVPYENRWPHTSFNASFGTFGVDRYLMTNDLFAVKDAAATVPYDQIIILVNSNAYENIVGVFEGGGYMEKGVYRPYRNCRMRSNEAPGFCPVCSLAISRMIRLYSE